MCFEGSTNNVIISSTSDHQCSRPVFPRGKRDLGNIPSAARASMDGPGIETYKLALPGPGVQTKNFGCWTGANGTTSHSWP